MSAGSHETPKKSSSVLEKLGQRITNIREDIADNLERRKQSYSHNNSNQVHFITRTHTSEDSLVIEKKPPTPPEIRQRQPSDEDNPIGERTFSITQLAVSLGKKVAADAASVSSSVSDMVQSTSYQDLFSADNNEQAKEMIINGVRQDCHHNYNRAVSEHGSDENIASKVESTKRPTRKASQLLAGPRFRAQTIEPETNGKRDSRYSWAIAVGVFALILTLWKPISPFISGFLLGFVVAVSIAYAIIRLYLNAKVSEQGVHEWMDFSDLETMLEDKVTKPDKRTSLNTCGEIVFGRYDADRDEEFTRYPAVIRLENYRLIIQLPTKAKIEERKDKEIKFVGYREYLIKEASLILVPEATLTRIKYWLNEYPIMIQNLQLLDKQIVNKQSYEKSKFDTDDFFNNPQTTLSLFFETGPDKEDWFHKLSLVLKKGKEDIERANRFQLGMSTISASISSPALNTITLHNSNPSLATSSLRSAPLQASTVHLEDRVQMKPVEVVGPPYADTTSLDKSRTDSLRSQINETDIVHDMAQGRNLSQRTRTDSSEREKEKDVTKKKLRKHDENLQRLLDSPDCLDEAALTLNFLLRRLFCDVFEEPLFKDLLKEKIELKLKEIALTVLEDLHVETIEMGNTFPIILKVEPMQWNTKGIWFNLFVLYRGSFKTTIKTRIVLKRLLNSNSASEQPLFAQNHPAQVVHRDEERMEEDDLVQRHKLLAKEPEVAESVASRKLGTLLTKVAANKHFQRFASFKPVADVMEKLSNSEVGVNIELLNISGIMTINIPPPPSDRIWIGFSEMPELNLKVTPVFGESKYSYALIHDFLEARIRDEIKRLLVLPSMDDQLLPFMRDWVLDVIGEIAAREPQRTESPKMKKTSQLHKSISDETNDF